MPKIINPTLAGRVKSKPKQLQETKSQSSFNDLFQKQLKDNIKVSKHAKNRIQSRDIKIDSKVAKKLDEAMEILQQKGSKDSLLIVNNVAYVVNPQSKTVITAVDEQNLKEKVFTNIDSAMLL
ncbi:TIGR02530 family flagellar biosynthesis protein [Proteinivorax hydrogeniformans]|uniref:TIGR02530 family flagellar biosynthesis protein n=1 Tax=Proteinivorax hydrogeniformans TaxID=1826727 RepID=A0AAU8HQV7_9FIRM